MTPSAGTTVATRQIIVLHPERIMATPGVAAQVGAEGDQRRPLGSCDQPARRSRANVSPLASRTDARSEATEALGVPARRWFLSRATSRWSASTHSLTLPWFVTPDGSPQYRQTLFLGGDADVAMIPSMTSELSSTHMDATSAVTERVTAENPAGLYRLAHTNRRRSCFSATTQAGRCAVRHSLRWRPGIRSSETL